MVLKAAIRKVLYRIRGDYSTEKLVSMGMRVGRNFRRLHGVILDPAHCWLITIGDNVTMAPCAHILAHDASTFCHLGYTRIGRVHVGNNVFIGASTVILPNVRIGDNSIIGANSTVSRDVPPNSVVAGNPARYVCSLDDFLAKNRKTMQERPCYGEEYTVRGGIDETKKSEMQRELENGPAFVV